MKLEKIKNLTRIFAFIFSVLLCLSAISCKKDKKEEPESIHKTNVIRRDVAEYGNFIYYSGDRIYRYNRVTNTISPACPDPECDGNCPVDCVMTYFTGIYDGRLYFYGYQQWTHNVFLAYQDVVTGEIKVLKTLSAIEDSSTFATFVDGDYFYYNAMVLKEGGDAAVSGDYEKYICRIPKDGGKEEKILKPETSEFLLIIAQGKVITELDGKIYSTNTESREKKELFNFAANGYVRSASPISYLDGKIYFAAATGQTFKSEYYNNSNITLNVLIWLDINTGDSGRISETPVAVFCVTDDAIYYSPFNERPLYIPDNYKERQEDIRVTYIDASLYACGLDGKNIRKVYTNEAMNYTGHSGTFTVINGVLYGQLIEYVYDANETEIVYYGSIDFESGEIIKTEKPKFEYPAPPRP